MVSVLERLEQLLMECSLQINIVPGQMLLPILRSC
jgi:hypothetical protein